MDSFHFKAELCELHQNHLEDLLKQVLEFLIL